MTWRESIATIFSNIFPEVVMPTVMSFYPLGDMDSWSDMLFDFKPILSLFS